MTAGGGSVFVSFAHSAPDITKYEGRTIASVEVVMEGAVRDAATETEILSLVHILPDSTFSFVRVREALQTLFDSRRVSNARVEAEEVAGPGTQHAIRLRFIFRPQLLVGGVAVDLGANPNPAVSRNDIEASIGRLQPGARITDRALSQSADAIQSYLHDRGFYQAEVSYTSTPDQTGLRPQITFHVNLGEQARVGAFRIEITGWDQLKSRPILKIQPGAAFSRSALSSDVGAIRSAIVNQGHLAPVLDDPQVQVDFERNLVSIDLKGALGPTVAVKVEGYKLSKKEARQLLPVEREGSIDEAAIAEGQDQLQERLQESGYFFARVSTNCSVIPAIQNTTTTTQPVTDSMNLAGGPCSGLNPAALTGRTVNIGYNVDRGRRFKLTEIRIEGTRKVSYDDVAGQLHTKKANILGFIPYFGYGNGYASRETLDQDQQTIEARLRDLGYRKAAVNVGQSASAKGDLVITFDVKEGPLTRVAGVEIRGNELYTEEKLRDEPCQQARGAEEGCTVLDAPFSNTVARSDADRLRSFYAKSGYTGTEVNLSVVNLPDKSGDEQVKIVYTVKEGGKVLINRIRVNGLVRTKLEAVLRAIPVREGQVLQADQLTESERILYQTNVFRQVIIRTEDVGETASGYREQDVIIDVEEQKPRVMEYGGGYSTDTGPLGLFDIENDNLSGKLKQGVVRTRISSLQQLVRLEYTDPRFKSYGKRQFAPLSLSVEYERNSSVTRFFRSTIDTGNFGIVQRLDAKGNPIDEFGKPTGEPTINRFTINLETRRDFGVKLGSRGEVLKRNTLFLRYSYQDVRLFNVSSLLIAPILLPDRAVRISRFGASFSRDTRDAQFDATRGEYLTADYTQAFKPLGGSFSYKKFQSTYRRYYKFDPDRKKGLLGSVLAGGFQLGIANLSSPRSVTESGPIEDAQNTLPISERFFSGGSTTLRGFGFEEAGPRVAICPGGGVMQNGRCPPSGIFRDSNGNQVTLNPFLVPIGGNAFFVANAELRVPVTNILGIVPFYDGGSVYYRIGDIFGHAKEEDPNLRAHYTNTVGVGFRIKTPFGSLGLDYGYLLKPPEFLLPQQAGPPVVIRLQHAQINFRFGQSF